MDRHVTSILETIPSHLFDQGMFPPSFPREVSDFYFQYQNMTHTDIAAVDPRHLLLDFRRALLYHDRWIDTFVATRLAAQSPDMRRAQAQIESTMNGDDGGAFGSGSTESSESSNAIDLARTIADASSKGRAGPSTRQLISGLLSTPRDSYRFPKDAHIVKEERFSDDQSDYDDDDETATVLRQVPLHETCGKETLKRVLDKNITTGSAKMLFPPVHQFSCTQGVLNGQELVACLPACLPASVLLFYEPCYKAFALVSAACLTRSHFLPPDLK
eukprot:GHVT01022191.1.p2 GENE.GHVT01022191.1~~GHVT01022191.1.p2  ORF type:complete len:273 (+),score=40.99 GHVT01022191.1:3338-4156(+)